MSVGERQKKSFTRNSKLAGSSEVRVGMTQAVRGARPESLSQSLQACLCCRSSLLPSDAPSQAERNKPKVTSSFV